CLPQLPRGVFYAARRSIVQQAIASARWTAASDIVPRTTRIHFEQTPVSLNDRVSSLFEAGCWMSVKFGTRRHRPPSAAKRPPQGVFARFVPANPACTRPDVRSGIPESGLPWSLQRPQQTPLRLVHAQRGATSRRPPHGSLHPKRKARLSWAPH